MNVKKRDGRIVPFDADKIHKMVSLATEGLEGVSLSEVEMAMHVRISDGVTTSEIQDSLVRAAADLINESSPNYQWVGSRLRIWALRDEVWGGNHITPTLKEIVEKNVIDGMYAKELLALYSEADFAELENHIDHDRDFLHTMSGVQQFCDKYCIQNRSTGRMFETPQFAYMCIAMMYFRQYEGEDRMRWVKESYDATSLHKVNRPTPILCGLRSPIPQYASCCLIDIDDSLDSIASSVQAVMRYTSQRAGIGINIGRLRSLGSSIRSGEVISTGLVPFLKVLEAGCKSTSQNGVRGGGATVNCPIWHYEIETILILKSPTKGSQDTKVNQLDYCIAFDGLFYGRAIRGEDMHLLDPNECEGLYDAYGTPEFKELYEKFEADPTLKFKKKIKAMDLFIAATQEAVETGRYYTMNIDHVNTHGSWLEKVNMSNLCVEINHPTKPLNHIDDPEAEIGICILAAVNVLNVEPHEMEKVSELIVRELEEVIDTQKYPVLAGKTFSEAKRSLGIGITNLAAYLAKLGLSYSDDDTPNVVSDLAESLQFNLLKASAKLAEERGAAPHFHKTKYAEGKLPIDHYYKKVDKFVTTHPKQDWEWLRARIKDVGLRNCTLTAQMPCESSSVLQNSTNGIEPPRSLIVGKKSKMGVLRQVVPNYEECSQDYTLAWDMGSNVGLLRVVGAIQKWFDMSISANVYYRYANYPEGKLPISEVIKERLIAYSCGVKNIYYTNTDDGNKHFSSDDTGDNIEVEEETSGCAGGACTL